MTVLQDHKKHSGWEWLKSLFRKEQAHIACPCRPKMNLCGRYDDTPMSDEPVDGTECPDCLDVLYSTGCPNCGCPEGLCCPACCEDGCHEV